MPPKDVNTKTKRRARKRNRRVASDSSSSSSSGSDSSSDEEAPLVPALLAARAAKGKERAFGQEGSVPLAAVVAQVQADEDDSSSDESSSSSSSSSSSASSSSSSSASSTSSIQKTKTTQSKLALNPSSASNVNSTNTTASTPSRPKPSRTSRSPSPPPAKIPSFFNTSARPSFLPPLPAASTVNSSSESANEPAKEETEEELKRKRFREFWMGKMVVGFGQDLDTVRQEPSLTSSRLNLLINSLTSGIDVFSTGAGTNPNGRSDGADDKMEVDERDVVLGKI